MLLASVHHPNFMAYDVSASRKASVHHLKHRAHRTGVRIAFCTKNCCSPMLIVKISSHCVIAAGKLRWFVIGKKPALLSKDMPMAT